MEKIKLVILIYSILFINSRAFCDINELDNLRRTSRDIQRSMKYDSLKDLELQKEYQLPQQKIKTFTQDLDLKGQTEDRAAIRNEQRLKEMMEAQKKSLSQQMDSWGLKIPKRYRLIIEFFAIALFITFFSTMFYKQRIKRQEEEKKSAEERKSEEDLYKY